MSRRIVSDRVRGGLLLGAALALLMGGSPARAEQVKEAHHLLGSLLEITVEAEDRETAQNRIRDAVTVAHRLESQLGLGDGDGETEELCARAGRGPVQVPIDLYRLLAFSKVMTRSTGGAFDVTVGPLLRREPRGGLPLRRGTSPDRFSSGSAAADTLSGESSLPSVPPAAQEGGDSLDSTPFGLGSSPNALADVDVALSLVGADKVQLIPPDQAELTVVGMSVDFALVAKGYVLERMAMTLRKSGVTKALLEFRDSVVLAIGPPADEEPFQIWIAREREMAGSVTLRDRSVATIRTRRPTEESSPQAIVDPRSGRFVEVDRQATVVALDAAVAESWSTALVVDPDGVLALLQEPRDVEALVFDAHGQHFSPRFQSFSGWKAGRKNAASAAPTRNSVAGAATPGRAAGR